MDELKMNKIKMNIFVGYLPFLARDVIIHLVLMLRCQYPSVCSSVTFVYCGHRVRWIPDTFACLDRWMSLLLTDNASPGSLDGMMPGFLVEQGGNEKLVIVAILLILLIFYRWTRNMWWLYLYEWCWRSAFFILVISVENALYLKNGLC